MSAEDDRPTTAEIAGAAGADAGDETAEREDAREHGDGGDPSDLEPLLGGEDADAFRTRWHSVQTAFVDEPRQAVEQADALVAELMQRLAQTFAEERESLEGQWSRGEDVSTEDLRVALQRYRSFFERLLSA